jgi:hypothetical protein
MKRFFGLIAICAIWTTFYGFGSKAFDLYRAGYPGKQDWVEIAKTSSLKPCFPNATFVQLQARALKHVSTLADDEIAELEAQGRIIPKGTNKGIVVPDYCFAVETGLMGFNITYWQRPRLPGAQYDMTIPFYNPAPEERRVGTITKPEEAQS